MILKTIPSYHDSVSQNCENGTYPTCDAIYNSAALEKTARAYEVSSIKRAISKNTVVIVDDLNYIKGFRYQLWCEAKAAGTRCCTVHCAAREDEVENWNRERLRGWSRLNDQPFDDEEDAQPRAQIPVEEGEMLPESHTAIYGDRIPIGGPKSRTSSMGGSDGDDPENDDQLSFAFKKLPVSSPLRQVRSENTFENPPVGDQSALDKPNSLSIRDFPPPKPQPYSTKTLKSILMRYEPPSPFSKWDTPLFTVPASDAQPPISAIWTALFPPTEANQLRDGGLGGQKAEVKPHAATVLPRMTEADALQSLEKVTADIVRQIDLWSKSTPNLADEGGETECKFAGSSAMLSIPIGTNVSLPMLHRLKRRFLQIQRGGMAHGRVHVSGENAVGAAFVRFLNTELSQ